MAGWKLWKQQSSTDNPWRHWLAEDGLRKLQDWWLFAHDCWYSIRVYTSNRFRTQTHVLPTGLEVGQWHEFETRLIHGLFNTFCIFVETEQCSSNKPSREEGLTHLIWAAHLRYTDEWINPTEEHYGKLTGQAIAAREQLELYYWWRDIRPNRPNAWDDMDSYQEVEARYDAEDEEMMIRLIKLRRSIWS
jgi:hypothetical protein